MGGIIKMELLEGMNYREWQKRNTQKFEDLAEDKQQKARQMGYCNRGWEKVKKSWSILCELNNNLISLFDYQLHKGKVNNAIDIAILEAEKVKEELLNNQKSLEKLANETLAKYPLL
jgi:hypothetical protein